jgi:glycosyltransferase involved in cell wall biosynthesis
LAPEKAIDTLVRAVADTGRKGMVVLLAGDGPERERLRRLAEDVDVRLVIAGDLDWERIVEAYVAADVFALVSRSETWGVVVNEAAACGLPLVLSDAVGAAHDLLIEGENGFVVSPGDVAATAAALRELADDPADRARFGAASRRIVAGWGYETSVEGFVELVRLAAGHNE